MRFWKIIAICVRSSVATMSSWTHVTLTAEVSSSCFRSPEILKAQVEEDFRDLSGVITGSEGNVELFVLPLPSSSCNCCNGKVEYFWSEALLVVHGHLRDREKSETEKEVETFVESLKERFSSIRDLQYNVWGEDEPCWIKGE